MPSSLGNISILGESPSRPSGLSVPQGSSIDAGRSALPERTARIPEEINRRKETREKPEKPDGPQEGSISGEADDEKARRIVRAKAESLTPEQRETLEKARAQQRKEREKDEPGIKGNPKTRVPAKESNLTPGQRDKLDRARAQRQKENVEKKTGSDETSQKTSRSLVENDLTPEQRARLEQARAERRKANAQNDALTQQMVQEPIRSSKDDELTSEQLEKLERLRAQKRKEKELQAQPEASTSTTVLEHAAHELVDEKRPGPQRDRPVDDRHVSTDRAAHSSETRERRMADKPTASDSTKDRSARKAKTIDDLTPDQRQKYERAKVEAASSSKPPKSLADLTDEEKEKYLALKAKRKVAEKADQKRGQGSGLSVEQKEKLSSAIM